MRTEYRLTTDGFLLDPATADPEQYAAATRRWLVETLPTDPGLRRRQQVAAMAACDVIGAEEEGARALADAVMHRPSVSAVVPDDVVALKVTLVGLSDGLGPVRAATVFLVARIDRAVTTSTDATALARLVQRVRELPASRRRGAFVVTRALISLALEDATSTSDQITARTATLEETVFSASVTSDEVVADIYRQKRAIAEVRRHVQPAINRLALITEVDDAELGEEAVTHLERLEAGLRRVIDTIETDDRLLGDMLTAQLALVQVQQNSDMRRISAYAALITVPTLIAGIYGMNFDRMPELSWAWGYPASIGVMVVAVLLLRRGFRRSGWL